MILTIDVGNSNIVLGGVEGDDIVLEARLRTDSTKTSDEYCIDLKMILDVYNVSSSQIEGTIIASVVPQVLNSMQTAVMKLTGKTSLVVGPGIKTGLKIQVENPAQTGADLVVGCVAALREHKAPMIIIDMGTATTYSVIDNKKNYIGGMITTGMAVSTDALIGRTAQLPKIAFDTPKRLIGKNTVECLQSGIMYSTACSIDGMIERIEDEIGEKCTVIATGGLAHLITPLCKREIILDEDLMLKGLINIYKRNCEK